MSGGSPDNGVVGSYDDMTPIPVISYSPTNNAVVINNPAQTTENITVDGRLPLAGGCAARLGEEFDGQDHRSGCGCQQHLNFSWEAA